jgi:predicted dehydrogenase
LIKEYLRHLIADGFVGEVLSTPSRVPLTNTWSGARWSPGAALCRAAAASRPRKPGPIEPGNVARAYARLARDLRAGTRLEDAVAVHRITAAIERAAESGNRTAPA